VLFRSGHIAEAVDEATGAVNATATPGDILTVRGHGLKVEGADAGIGFFFTPTSGAAPVKARALPLNKPRTLKVLVPSLTAGEEYALVVVTQGSVGHGGNILATPRQVEADFTIKAASL
jgi:hypothetical protein